MIAELLVDRATPGFVRSSMIRRDVHRHTNARDKKMNYVIGNIATEIVSIASTIPFGKIALVLSLILLIDHGVRHLKDRFHDWNGRWFCKLALTILALGLVCHAIFLCGKLG